MKKLLTMALIFVSVAMQAQISIINRTQHEEADEIAKIITEQIIEFDTLNVVIFPFPSGATVLGAVAKSPIEEHRYTLFLNRGLSLKRLRTVISHEFVHIKQYESEGLEIFGDIWCWNPDSLESEQEITWGSMTYTGYEDREFELDAYRREVQVNKKLLKIIKANKSNK